MVSWTPRPPRFRWYGEEERQLWKIKVATDNIINGSFGSTHWKWTPNNFSFFESPIGLTLSYQWQSVESLCTAITDLSGNGIPLFLKKCLELLFHRIEDLNETLSKECFLLQMVYIWRICLNLTKIRLPLPTYELPNSTYPVSIHPLAPSFLHLLDTKLAAKFGPDDPTCQVISSLLFIFRSSPQRFKTALQLGYRMTIKVFENRLGPNNNMVLKMWSHFGRVCGRTITLRLEPTESICRQFTTYIKSIGEQVTPKSLCYLSGLAEMAVAESSHRLGNLSQYEVMMPNEGGHHQMEDITRLPSEEERSYQLEDIIMKLRHMVMGKLQVTDKLDDSLAVEVFVYTTKLLALKLNRQFASSYRLRLLDDSIKILRGGGTDCILWASTLSKERLHILAGEKECKELHDEKARLSAIRKAFSIPNFVISSGSRGIARLEGVKLLSKQELKDREDLRKYLDMLCFDVMFF